MTEKLTERQKRLAAKSEEIHKELDDVNKRLKAKNRKRLTRFKIVVGAAMIKYAETDREFNVWLYRHMDARLKRSQDRDVFDELFPPEPVEPKAEERKDEAGKDETRPKE